MKSAGSALREAEQGNHAEALLMWQQAHRAAPDQARPLLGMVRALAALGRPQDILQLIRDQPADRGALVDSVLSVAARKLPNDLQIGLAHCRSGDVHEDARQAAARWWALRKRLPRKLPAHLGYIDCLIRQAGFAEAQRATLSAIEKLGRRPPLLHMHARIAESRLDWPDALARLHDLAADHPDAHNVQARIAAAAAHVAQGAAPPADAHQPHPAEASAEFGQAERAASAKLLKRFESLGRNCEFGLLQRHFGAEPLGLLRFATTRVATLLRLLKTRFDGVGDPASNEVVVVQKEYRLRHLPSGWRMHTRIAPDQMDPPAALALQCRHTGFLKAKLLRDLAQATKILVYQSADLTEDDARALHRALRAHGPNMLMCVRLFTDQHPVGTVLWLEDDLMLAHIDRQGQEFRGAGWDISVDWWLHFCNIAWTHRHAATAKEPPANGG